MRTRENKAQFAARMNHEKKNREELRKVYNTVFLPLLKKYNGKVFNARFVNELRDNLQKVSPLMSCREESQHCEDITLFLEVRNSPHNYNDTERLYIKVICDRDENYNYRVNAEKSTADRYAAAWLDNFDKSTAEKTAAAKGYDKFLKLADKMEAIIKEYNELPADFRQIVETAYLHIY